jgi:hypothetical protein
VISWFQAFAFEWVNLYRYTVEMLHARVMARMNHDVVGAKGVSVVKRMMGAKDNSPPHKANEGYKEITVCTTEAAVDAATARYAALPKAADGWGSQDMMDDSEPQDPAPFGQPGNNGGGEGGGGAGGGGGGGGGGVVVGGGGSGGGGSGSGGGGVSGVGGGGGGGGGFAAAAGGVNAFSRMMGAAASSPPAKSAGGKGGKGLSGGSTRSPGGSSDNKKTTKAAAASAPAPAPAPALEANAAARAEAGAGAGGAGASVKGKGPSAFDKLLSSGARTGSGSGDPAAEKKSAGGGKKGSSGGGGGGGGDASSSLPSWMRALVDIAASPGGQDGVLSFDDDLVVMRDKYPKGRVHLLVGLVAPITLFCSQNTFNR